MLSHLDDREFLAQIEAVDHFMDNMIAYPGRTFGQLYHHFFRANDLADGVVTVDGRRISLGELAVPVLAVAGQGAGIAPRKAVRRLLPLLEKSPETRYEVCPGGHLGVLTGRNARDTTWPIIDRFLDDHAA